MRPESLPGCICIHQPGRVTRRADGGFDWDIDPDCGYHRTAAEHPDDHSIPWNCPTFFDGCNCDHSCDEPDCPYCDMRESAGSR